MEKYLLVKQIEADSIQEAESVLWTDLGGIKEGWGIIRTSLEPGDTPETSQLKMLLASLLIQNKEMKKTLTNNLVEG